MFKWLPYAMARVTALFIAGILVAYSFHKFISATLVLNLFLSLFPCYFLCVVFLRRNRALNLVSGVIGLTAVFLAGYLNLLNHDSRSTGTDISRFQNSIQYYSGQITNTPEERNNSFRFEIDITAINSDGGWIPRTGHCLVYIAKDTTSLDLQYGDRVLIKGPLKAVPSPSNPDEFDFSRYLRLKNISHQQFVHREQVLLINRQSQRGIVFYSQNVRSWAALRIEKFVSGKREQAITKALVLGVTDGLDNELLGAYAASGATHILSVSGLHVGIIYAIILIILRPFSDHAWGRWSVVTISLICLWCYAFVTGLSPSVLRSVTMFSFMVIARPFGRQTNIYNTLASSAFLLLVYDPFLILSVGFQLSYLAVLGIVYLQRSFSDLWEPNSWVVEKIWQAICVSMAAQFATFALGLYYFHQFPVYFLLANLIVIPLSSLILLIGISLLIFSAVPWLANLAGVTLEFLIGLLNGCTFMVEGLPGSLVEGVHITGIQCCLLILILISFVLLFETRKFRFAVAAMTFVGFFSILEWATLLKESYHGHFIVYDVTGHSAMEWIDGGQSICYMDSGLIANKDLIRYHLLPHRIKSGVKKTRVDQGNEAMRSFSGFRVMKHNGMVVVFIEKESFEPPRYIITDYLVVGKDALKSFAGIQDKIKFKRLILDGSNSVRQATQLIKEAKSKNIEIHSVASDGAFQVNL